MMVIIITTYYDCPCAGERADHFGIELCHALPC